jgi:hypothetical protein
MCTLAWRICEDWGVRLGSGARLCTVVSHEGNVRMRGSIVVVQV